jgi:NuA3 HAT complex component NTO1
MSTVADTAEVESQIIGDRSRKDLSSEQKEKRKLAKRIIKAIQPALTSATHKESELCRRPFEKELRDLDMLLETSFSSRRDSSSGSLAEVEGASDEEPEDQKPRTNGTALGHANMAVSEVPVRPNSLPNGAFHGSSDMEIDNLTAEGNSAVVGPVIGPQLDFVTNGVHSKESLKDHQPTPEDSNPTPMFSEVTTKDQLTSAPASRLPPPKPIEPPTPPLSSGGDLQIPLTGGIPWYMDPFDPTGTTLYEERWTGRDVARDMSEELSDMDEEELSGLVDNSLGGGVDSMDIDLVADSAGGGNVATAAAGNASARKKNGKPRRRWKGFR